MFIPPSRTHFHGCCVKLVIHMSRGKVGHQRETPCGPEGRLEEVQFEGLRRKGNMWGGASIPHTLP